MLLPFKSLTTVLVKVGGKSKFICNHAILVDISRNRAYLSFDATVGYGQLPKRRTPKYKVLKSALNAENSMRRLSIFSHFVAIHSVNVRQHR